MFGIELTQYCESSTVAGKVCATRKLQKEELYGLSPCNLAKSRKLEALRIVRRKLAGAIWS